MSLVLVGVGQTVTSGVAPCRGSEVLGMVDADASIYSSSCRQPSAWSSDGSQAASLSTRQACAFRRSM